MMMLSFLLRNFLGVSRDIQAHSIYQQCALKYPLHSDGKVCCWPSEDYMFVWEREKKIARFLIQSFKNFPSYQLSISPWLLVRGVKWWIKYYPEIFFHSTYHSLTKYLIDLYILHYNTLKGWGSINFPCFVSLVWRKQTSSKPVISLHCAHIEFII